MEYTKDIILHVNYGQTVKENNRFIKSVKEKLSKHKILTFIISITVMLIALDFILISSFVNLLIKL